jgi:Flp pilus assembly protein CpaB
MQRGRIFILVGALLAIAAIAVMMLMGGAGGGDKETPVTPDGGEPVVEIIPPTPTPIPNPIIVAKQRIPRGTELITTTQIGLREWVSIETWPMGWVADDALRTLDQVNGRISRLDIPRGTILTGDMLTDQAGDLAKTGSDAALLIPPGRVAMAIPVDHISSLGWALRRGDHVDVLVSFLMTDLDEEFQTEMPNYAAGLVPINTIDTGGTVLIQGVYGRIEQDPFGQPLNVIPGLGDTRRPRLVSQITVRDAEVLNVGPWLPWSELFHEMQALGATGTDSTAAVDEGQAVDGAEGDAAGSAPTAVEFSTSDGDELLAFLESFSRQPVEPLLLIVSPQETLVLKWCIEQKAPMHLVLRSHADAGVRLPDTEAVTLQYMTTMYAIALPPGLPYGIEPAVRALERSLLLLPDTPLILAPPQTQSDTPPR